MGKNNKHSKDSQMPSRSRKAAGASSKGQNKKSGGNSKLKLSHSTAKKKTETRKIWKKVVIIVGMAGLLVISAGIAAATYYVNKESVAAEKIELSMGTKPIVKSFRILDANNKPIQESVKQIKYQAAVVSGDKSNVPDIYTKTLVAVEDHSFYSRLTKGFSTLGIINAVGSSLRSKIDSSYQARGGSTIDQQLVKALAFGGYKADRSFSRKVVELIDAHSLAKRYSRDQILEAYMNSLRLTPETIGANAGWNSLFKGDFKQDKLTPLYIAQLAFMAGLGQAPTTYTQQFDSAGRERTLTVLSIMKKNKIISRAQYEEAAKVAKKDLKLDGNISTSIPHAYQAYLYQVNQELGKMDLPENAELTVKTYTTKEQLEYLEKIAKREAPDASNIPNSALPTGILTALSVVDTKTGHILGLATNSDNPSIPITSERSSASTIKPLLDYIPALEYGRITAYSTLNGNNSSYTDGTPLPNYGGVNYGQVPVSLALGASLNSAALQTYLMTTDAEKNTVMRPLGIAKSNYTEVESISYNISPLQNASAYSAIGNDGVRIEPTAIEYVEVNGKKLELAAKQASRAMSSATAKTVVSLLQNVTQPNGSEPLAAQPQWPNAFASKSGLSNFPPSATEPARSNGTPDAWMVGTSSGVTVASWLGSPDMSGKYYIPAAPISEENNMRVYLLNNTIQYMNQGRDVSPFTYSGEGLSHETADLTVPTKPEIPSSSEIESINQFSPTMPSVDKSLQDFYNSHQNTNFIDPNTVFGAK